MDWLSMQLADSAFPAGGFAHSAGMEAAHQLGELAPGDVERFVREAIWQAGFGSLPVVGAAHRDPSRVGATEATYDAFLTGAVSNRASRIQGRAFASASARSFGGDALWRLHDDVRERRLLGHHAPLFGAVAAALGVSRPDALAIWMHTILRGQLSAAVRLGLAGAHEAQAMQRATAPLLDRVVAACGELDAGALVQTAPRLDVTANQHDHLYSRLFQS
ncbi:MAG: urease accessory UreF family protein [Polyangiaceae bacterium]